MRYIAIDVGISGAIAVLDNNYQCVYDMPTLTSKDKERIDAFKLSELLRTLTNGADDIKLMIEEVHAMPKQGVSSMFNFGTSYGIIIGVCGALGIEVVFIRPQKWKNVYVNLIGNEDAKSRARELAIEYFPNLRYMLERKKDHNRADALLMAKYLQMEAL